jgi:hypothetical protein
VATKSRCVRRLLERRAHDNRVSPRSQKIRSNLQTICARKKVTKPISNPSCKDCRTRTHLGNFCRPTCEHLLTSVMEGAPAWRCCTNIADMDNSQNNYAIDLRTVFLQIASKLRAHRRHRRGWRRLSSTMTSDSLYKQ